MKYRVILTEDAVADFKILDGSIRNQVAKQLKKLEYAPYLGEHLGKKGPFNLTGYYKLYVAKKSIRIVVEFPQNFKKPLFLSFQH
ncbi:MAG: hypothetical protein AABY84_13150, partial [Candidatus Firestonebacteria bacterium]